VDDETFLNMMDGQNFGIDMNPTFDVDDDGILPSTFDDEYASEFRSLINDKQFKFLAPSGHHA
jgi:hypothetical protein